MDRRSNIRFQFNSFKSDAWDIEHVRSVAEGQPGAMMSEKSG